MQRLVSHKLVSNFPRKAFSESNVIYRPHTNFTKSSQTDLFSSSIAPKAQTFISNRVLGKAYSSHSSKALFTNAALKSFSDFRVAFRKLQFHNRSFQQHSGFNSFQRRWRAWLQNLSPDNFVLSLIVANVAVFLLWRIANTRFMMNNFTISVENIKRLRLHTLITPAFSHMDTAHILHNMVGLYFFGCHLGQVFGTEFLFKLYLAGGIAGSVFYLAHSLFLASSAKGPMWMDPLRTPGLGASGAVNAIILLDIFLYPRSTLLFNFFIPVPAILLGIYLIGKDLMGMIEGETPGSAHLGGAVVAAVAWARIRRGRF